MRCRPLREELFHVANDPKETLDLAARKPDAVARLRGLADAYLARGTDHAPRTESANAKTHERLEALGSFAEEE